MRKFSKSLRVFTVALIVCVIAFGFALTACSSNKGGATLDCYDAVMYVGDKKVLTAEAVDKNGKPFTGTYEWSTSNDSVVRVSNHIEEKCEIEAVATGSAVVTVKAGNFSASCDVYVLDEPESIVKSVSLDKTVLELIEGGEGTLTATAAMSDGKAYDGTDFEWKIVSGESFVSITPSGTTCTITAVAAGTAEISVTVDGVSATCKVTVTAVHVHTYPSPDDDDFKTLVTWDWEGRDTESKTVKITVVCRDCGESEVFEATYTESSDGNTLSATVKVGNYDYSSTYDVETGSSEQSGHTHSYTASWEWDESDYSCKVTLTCSDEDGTCSNPTVSLEATVKPDTVDSTCEVAGSVTYTASVEYGGVTYTTEGNDVKVVELPLAAHTLVAVEKVDTTCTEDGTEAYWKCSVCGKLFSDEKGETEIEAATVIPATGHTYPDTTETSNIQWNWESRVGDETSGTVSVTLICTKCGKEIGTFDTSYSVDIENSALLHAEYSIDNKTYSDTFEIAAIPTEYHIDFSNPDTYSWLDTTFTTESTYGIITVPVSSKMSFGEQLENSLNTGGKASDKEGEATYIKLDLSEFVGQYVSITITMCSNGGENSDARTLVINDSVSSSNPLASISSAVKDADQLETLTYSDEITSANMILYITCDASVNIFTIDIVIGDEDPDYCHCSSSSYPDATDSKNVVWDWIGRDEEKMEVSVTIYCTECGKIIETVKTNYAIDQNDKTKWTASVEAGGNTYTSTFDIPVEGEEATTESFIVPMTADGENADSTTYSAGEAVVDNSIFTLTTVGSMEYSMGKKDDTNGYLLPYANVKFEDMSGTEHTPDQALLSSIQVTCSKTDDNVAVAASDDDILEITVHQNATIYLYVYFTNESYNQNLSGTMYYSVNGGDKVSYTLPKRTEGIVKMEMAVSAGDIVKIGAEHATLNSKNEVQTGRLWLFGAEAVATASSEDVELEAVVELDFNSGDFTIGELVAKDTGTDIELKYSNGTSTGFTAMGSGVTDKTKKTEIASQNGYTVLSFGGSATTSDNTISYTITKSGTYTVVMSYFSGTNNNGRYGVVLDSDESELGEDVKDSEKTDNDKTLMSRSVTFDAKAGDIIYIGSHSSGLYFTFIGIYIDTDTSDDEESGTTPSEHVHNYEAPTWNWSSDYSECEVTLTCKDEDGDCENKTVTVSAQVQVTYISQPDCTTAGSATYTATAEYESQTFTDVKENVSVSALGHTYPASNDSAHVKWDWEERDAELQKVNVMIYCSVCGTLITAETTDYDVEVNSPSYWYAEVSVGDITYSSMYKIPGEGSVYTEESFIVPMAQNETADAQSFTTGDSITTNSLFDVSAGVSMKYSIGTSYGAIQNVEWKDVKDDDGNVTGQEQANGSNALKFTTALTGTYVEPDQGICMSDAFTKNQEIDDILTITAKENVTLYVYVVFTNTSYNSNKKGKIFCSVNGGERLGEEELTSRTVCWTYGTAGIELKAGDVLTIGAEDSNGDAANFWFFAAEACTAGEKVDYGAVKTVTFNTNQTSIPTITRAVFNYAAVTAPVLPNVTDYYFEGWYLDSSCTVAYDFDSAVTDNLDLYAKWVKLDTGIIYVQGAYESIALEFTDTNASGVTIYYKLVGESSYTTLTDEDAVRQTDSTTVRVDIIGLQGDEYYNVKILTSANVQLAEYSIYVASYDRSGYAHFNYDEGVGAYNDDGTLKNGALVIYVTDENKNDVTNDMYVYSDGEYTKITTSDSKIKSCLTLPSSDQNYETYKEQNVNKSDLMCGIGEILNSARYTNRTATGIAALCKNFNGVVIRIVGEVKANLVDGEMFWGEDGEDHTYRWMVRGSYDIIGLTDLNADTNGGSEGDNGGLVRMCDAYDLTIEGVGEGAIVNGWGFHFIAYNANTGVSDKIGKSFEVRNLTFINYTEDAIGMEGQQSGSADGYLTASVERCWIHNNTFYAGYCEYPAESDKSEGDGSCDFKRGQYLTVSYNYFEDCHKTNLFGSSATSLQYNISMHHNFWYNCQSRMPMARIANIHFYNNYVLSDSGSLSYVVHARSNSYVYAEYNYFEGCQDVFLTHAISSDTTGAIKSYGNVMDNCYYSSGSADEYVEVSSRTAKIDNNCTYIYYGIDYTSFDTDSTLFYYDSAKGRSDCYITSAEQAKTEVLQTAGAFSRDKVVTSSQLISAEDVSKPQSPYFDLTGDAPDETSLTYSEVILTPYCKKTF